MQSRQSTHSTPAAALLRLLENKFCSCLTLSLFTFSLAEDRVLAAKKKLLLVYFASPKHCSLWFMPERRCKSQTAGLRLRISVCWQYQSGIHCQVPDEHSMLSIASVRVKRYIGSSTNVQAGVSCAPVLISSNCGHTHYKEREALTWVPVACPVNYWQIHSNAVSRQERRAVLQSGPFQTLEFSRPWRLQTLQFDVYDQVVITAGGRKRSHGVCLSLGLEISAGLMSHGGWWRGHLIHLIRQRTWMVLNVLRVHRMAFGKCTIWC